MKNLGEGTMREAFGMEKAPSIINVFTNFC